MSQSSFEVYAEQIAKSAARKVKSLFDEIERKAKKKPSKLREYVDEIRS